MHNHTHSDDHNSSKGLSIAVLLTAGFALVEFVGGWWSGSLALLGDAGHMITDSMALTLAWLAARYATRPPDNSHSYGYRRVEVLAALINAIFMIGIVTFIVIEAIERIKRPLPVFGKTVMAIASVGLMINVMVLRSLQHDGKQTLNQKGAVIHVIGDLLGSVAALIAGLVIWLSGWTLIDPILSLVIAALIITSALRLLRDVFRVLMEGVPAGVDLNKIESKLCDIPGVIGLHDLHVWTLAGDRVLLSAHVQIAQMSQWPSILAKIQLRLKHEFDITHATVQAEPPEYTAMLSTDSDLKEVHALLDDHRH